MSDEPTRLWEEYKLIQEKIDKIGEYQFKVKSWSATLLGAVLFGGVAISRVTAALFSALAVAIIFHISEKRQRVLSKRLGQRALAIEHTFRLFPPISNGALWRRVERRMPAMRFVPSIARAMSDESVIPGSSRFARLIAWLVANSNDVFYCVQYALLVVLLVVHLTSSHVRVLGWRGDPHPRYELSLGRFRIIIYRHAN